MLETIIMILAPILLSILVMVYINFGDIRAQKGLPAKLKSVLRFRKNKIVLFFLMCFGIGMMFWSHWKLGDALEKSLKQLFIFEFLTAVAYVDLKKQIIPNKLIIFAFFSYFVFFSYEVLAKDANIKTLLINAGLGLLLGGGVFGLSALFSKGAVGMGDIKLFSVLGILMGPFAVFNVIVYTVLLTAVYGIVMMLRKKKNKKSVVPAGPFALAGMMIAMFLGIGGWL
ncbi:MAG: A24 family peptidase [Clostridia bacterium]|nr:A24 family peptidase [Clostridia bacterium]